MHHLKVPALLTVIALTLAACGGGGSSTTTSQDTQPARIATV